MNTNTEEWGNIELPGLSDDELYKKNWDKVRDIKTLITTEKWKSNHTKGIKNRNATDWIDNVSNANKIKHLNEDFKKLHKQGLDKRNLNPIFQEILIQNGKKKSKPVVTPDGIFSSRKNAALFYKRGAPWVKTQIEKYPNTWYFISHEEYIMLTGKDI